MRLAAALIFMLACYPAASLAQQRSQSPGAPAPPQAPSPEPPPTAYEPDLLRMAEIVGSLAFLRQLCAGAEAAGWRARMSELLEAEGTTQGRRERLAGAYNRGFRGYALTYRSCTSAAEEAASRLTQDGERLSRALASRFGG
jgi:uncharacterized protein (TIGR02301 family)